MMRSMLVVAALALLLAPAVLAQDGAGDQGKQEDKSALQQAMEEELRARIQRDDWLVTMEFRDATVQEIVEEFRRQVRVSIVVDSKNVPEEFRVDEFIVKEVPFREAFGAFLEKSEMMIEEETASLIRISRPPRVDFIFKDADVRGVLDVIARVAKANIVVAPEIVGKISLNMHNVPWTDVLDAVVKTLNFTTVKERFGIIRVIHPDELRKQMETKVFPLRYIQPPPIFQANIESGKFVHGQHAQPPTKDAERLEGFFLKPTLEAVLTADARGAKLGRLDYDAKSNAFVVTDVKPVLDRVGQILKILDVEPAQVIIDVKYISTVNEDLLTFGMNFALQADEGATVTSRAIPPVRTVQSSVTQGTAATGPFTESNAGKISRMPFGLGHDPISSSQFFLTNYDMIATFRAFRRDKFTRILQEPTIAALDNEMATIFIGEQIRYAEQRATTNQFGGLEITISEASKSPVRVGFQLFILPRIIKESNKVLLTVIPINEVLSGTTSPLEGFERFELQGVGPGGSDVSIDLPRIRTATLVSKLLLESGKTAVLGGMVIERTVLDDKKIPLLGDLPIIGYLFKQTSDNIRKEHLLLFITPRIVRLDADNERIQAKLRQREESLRREFRRMKGIVEEEPAEETEEKGESGKEGEK
ncbi:MAG: type II secretion system protein GspD [Planctomycetota bacterium]|jgi:type IV pilus assembly protein PilQ